MKNKEVICIKIETPNQIIDLPVSKIVQIKNSDNKDFIYFDKLSDGSYRMTYTKNTIREIE